MNTDEIMNLENISKLTIQLGTQLKETSAKFQEEINLLHEENDKTVKGIDLQYKREIQSLKQEIAFCKEKIIEVENNSSKETSVLRTKFEKDVIGLREDMLKLLEKFESKFQNQDEDIVVLKQKCELYDCSFCGFQSFKIHFFHCEECSSVICSSCMQECKECKAVKCLHCLKKCNNCEKKFCKKCVENCKLCTGITCKECIKSCYCCSTSTCSKCMSICRVCSKSYCSDNNCASKCSLCEKTVCCKSCFEINKATELCVCGKLYCFNCEDSCQSCLYPCIWDTNSRVFTGYHTKTIQQLPTKSIVKLYISKKGIETTHLGITKDSEFKANDRPTETFWSLCLNSGEKFSTEDYKKKGNGWMKYAKEVVMGDNVYLRFNNGEVRFYINRKDYGVAFILDRKESYYLYCLTHNDSTEIELKNMKLF